jgi:hypothetical protein
MMRTALLLVILAGAPAQAPLRQSREPFVVNPRFCVGDAGTACAFALTEV